MEYEIPPPALKSMIQQAIQQALANYVSIVLKDSAGNELSGYVKNLDTPLSTSWREATLIPAMYFDANYQINGYSSISGGSFSPSAYSLSNGYWAGTSSGQYIEFQFYGTWFDVVFYQKSGVANIYLDGQLIATVDVSSLKGPIYNAVWHGPRNLSDDYHTVRIEVASDTIYVVGIMVDASKNAWRLVPLMQSLLTSVQNLWYFGTVYAGLLVRSLYSTSPVFTEKFPGYKTYVYTTTTLAAGGTWTSAWVDCLGSPPRARRIYTTLYSDQSGTMFIDYSPDGTNVDASESYSYTGGSTYAIGPIEVKGRYARVRYVNGNTDQSVFRLYAWFMGD
jgi:hypothetical protein